MSTPILTPQPQPQPQSQSPSVINLPGSQVTPAPAPIPQISSQTMIKLLTSPDFNNQDRATIRQQLAQHWNPAVASLNDDETDKYLDAVAGKLGVKRPIWAPTGMDQMIQAARPGMSDVAGMLSGLVTAGTGIGAPASAAVGLGSKVAVDALLQKLETKPPQGIVSKAAGFEPGSVGDVTTNTGTMLATNWGIGKVMGGLWRAGKELLNPVEQNLAKLPEQVLPTDLPNAVTRGVGGRFQSSPNTAANASNRTANEAAGFLPEDLPTNKVTTNHPLFPTDLPTNLPTDLPESLGSIGANKSPGSAATLAANKVLNARNEAVNQANFTTNQKNAATLAAQDLAFNNANKALNAKNAATNAALIESNKTANTAAEAKAAMSLKDLPGQFFNNLSTFSPWETRAGITGALTLPIGLFTGHTTAWEGAGAAYAGVKLGKAAIKTLSENPRTARIFEAMVNGQPLGVPQEYASKAITDVLQGASMHLTDASGKDTPVKLGANGQFTPVQP